MSIWRIEDEFVCEDGIRGKQTRLPFVTGRTRATKPGELIHSDVCGPMPEPTQRGSRYFVAFIDDFSSFCVIKVLKQNYEVLEAFRDFCNRTELEDGNKIHTLRTDNGRDCVNTEFAQFLSDISADVVQLTREC